MISQRSKVEESAKKANAPPKNGLGRSIGDIPVAPLIAQFGNPTRIQIFCGLIAMFSNSNCALLQLLFHNSEIAPFWTKTIAFAMSDTLHRSQYAGVGGKDLITNGRREPSRL